MRFHHAVLAALAATCCLWSAPRAVQACGGCFAPPPPPEDETAIPPLVNAHRMALSISTDQTVLWDQIRYSGNPSEFAWVLPIKPGAKIEVASDAFFDVLDAATNPIVVPPDQQYCYDQYASSCSVAGGRSGMGCGDSGAADDGGGGGTGGPIDPGEGVEIVTHGSAGPYEMVVLRSEDPFALTDWLESHDYAIDEEIDPVIEKYVTEGFDFVALRLLPGTGVQQMRPVRVSQPGAVSTLPLRMVAAGSGVRTAITLFVLGEGRYTTGNFVEAAIPPTELVFDFLSEQSNYTELRDELFEKNAQQTFLTAFAERGALFKRQINPITKLPKFYRTSDPLAEATYLRLSDAYVQQAFLNRETSSTDCAEAYRQLEFDNRRVVDPCDEDGECRDVDGSLEIDIRSLACDAPIGSDIELDDMAIALKGLHPKDVWVTRLEANLGRSAFGRDLELVPSADQREHAGFVQVTNWENGICEDPFRSVYAATCEKRPPRDRARFGMLAGLSMVLASVVGRRLVKAVKARSSCKGLAAGGVKS